jgi:hypothetical protein
MKSFVVIDPKAIRSTVRTAAATKLNYMREFAGEAVNDAPAYLYGPDSRFGSGMLSQRAGAQGHER